MINFVLNFMIDKLYIFGEMRIHDTGYTIQIPPRRMYCIVYV